MKRLSIPLVAALFLGYVGCTVEQETPSIKVESITIDQSHLTLTEGESVTLTATVLPEDAADKTVTWSSSNDDIVMIASNGKAKAMSLGKAVITAKAGDKTDFITITVSAKVIPVTGIFLIPSSITMKVGETQAITAEVTPQDATDKSVTWVSSNPDVATVENGTVRGLNPGSANVTAKTEDGDKTAECMVTVNRAAVLVESITLDKSNITLFEYESAVLTASVLPENASDKTLTWNSSDESVATVDDKGTVTAVSKGSAIIILKANDGSGVFASCAVRVKEPYTAVAGEAVDLGLSVKWSSTNLGATSPSDYGDYFSWGETEPKENYSWSTYKFGTRSSGPFSKYNTEESYGTVDNKIVLEPEDDAAHVSLGGKWRMPTDEEWTELMTKCTWTWTTQNGVDGRLVTAPNGNSIFLPAAGFRLDPYLSSEGSGGFYWSSSLHTDFPRRAWFVYFSSVDVDRSYDYRYYGRSVRPVTE